MGFFDASSNVIKKYESLRPMHEQGLSWEEMSSKTGIPVWQIRNFAGKNFPGYGIRQEAPRAESKPVGHTENTTDSNYPDLSLGAYGGGGGGNRASAAQLREYDQGIDETNHNLGRINTQLGIRRANINDDYRKKIDTLDNSIARARNQYDTQRTQNMQQRRNEVNVINDRASGDLRRLLRLLGGRGGGGSDVEKIARAVQDKANQERAGSSTAYAKDAQTLDTNWYNFNQDAEKERKGINDWKVNEERQATAQAETNRQGLLGYLAQLKSQKAEAMGQNGANAARADLGAARALSEKIDQLGRVQTTYTGKDPIYQPKPLDSYKVGSNTTVGVSHNNSQADDTTANVYTTKQTEDEERKKRNQWL